MPGGPARLHPAMTGLAVLLAVLLVSGLLGLLWRRTSGRLRSAADPDRLDPALLARLGVPTAPAVTLLQFSSEFCQPCRATRRLLAELAGELPGVRHVEVATETQLDAVRRLGILRTPTVLVLDRQHRVRLRASGQPSKGDMRAAVTGLLTPSPADAPGRAG